MKPTHEMGMAELQQTIIPPDYKNIEREITYAFGAFMGLGIGAVVALLMIYWGVI